MRDTPTFWRRAGWVMLIAGLGFMGLAVLQLPTNPAAVLVPLVMSPFVLFAAGLVTSNRLCEWMAKPEGRT